MTNHPRGRNDPFSAMRIGTGKHDAEKNKLLLCMGNPSGPAGHLPYEAEEFSDSPHKVSLAA